jgi:hypothetical protein
MVIGTDRIDIDKTSMRLTVMNNYILSFLQQILSHPCIQPYRKLI